jgi:ABC-type multidrug transport system permease subunit
MRFMWISALKDLRRLRRDPFSVAAWLAIPLVLAVLMNLIFGRTPVTPHGLLLVADEDNTIMSNMVIAAFGHEALSRMLTVETVKADQGLARINRGDGSALLIIPNGLSQAWMLNQPFRLKLITNPSQRFLPKVVEESLSTILDETFYARRNAPPARKNVEVESVVFQPQPQYRSFAALFFPSLIFMALLLVTNELAGEIWNERMRGTLRRVASTPSPLGVFLAGRILFVALVLCGIALAGLAAMGTLAGVPASNLTGAALWMVFSGIAMFLLFLLLALHGSSQRGANLLGNIVALPLAFLGGSFFPFELMPDWMARIGRMTPNGWAVVQFRAILFGSANAAALGWAITGLVLVGSLAFLVALRRLRRSFLV